MEVLENMGQEGMELEGSAFTTALLNTSLGGAANTTNVTFSPYYPHSLFVAASYILAYSFIFLLCMVGNILVCLIVLENRRMRTVTNLFILNLAVSDLLVGIFCIPTTLVDNLITGWPFSNMMCKMSGFVQGVSVSASVFTLVAIAAERFRCIVYPLRPKLTLLVAKAAIVSIWVLAMVIMCPSAVALTVERVPFHYMVYNDDFNHTLPLYTCYENFATYKMRKIYSTILFVHIYLAPLILIALMYGRIGVKLCTSVIRNREPQPANDPEGGRRRGQPMISQKKIRVIKMLIVVTLLFMLSWLPLWTLLMMTDYAGLDSDQLNLLTSYIFPFAHWLAFSNSSINPIIYGYYNENFKRGFKVMYKSRHFCCVMQCQLWSRLAKWRTKGRYVREPCGDIELRDATNHNHFVSGLRNRIHGDNKLSDTAEGNRGSRVGCVVVHAGTTLSAHGLQIAAVHKKSSNGEASEKISSPAVAVRQAWGN